MRTLTAHHTISPERLQELIGWHSECPERWYGSGVIYSRQRTLRDHTVLSLQLVAPRTRTEGFPHMGGSGCWSRLVLLDSSHRVLAMGNIYYPNLQWRYDLRHAGVEYRWRIRCPAGYVAPVTPPLRDRMPRERRG